MFLKNQIFSRYRSCENNSDKKNKPQNVLNNFFDFYFTKKKTLADHPCTHQIRGVYCYKRFIFSSHDFDPPMGETLFYIIFYCELHVSSYIF